MKAILIPRGLLTKGPVYSLSIWICFILWMLPVIDVCADGVVVSCNQSALEAAVQGGGRVTFGCDGTIVLTNTISVMRDVVLDGTGRDVTISGGNTVRVFHVSSGVSLGLVKLTVADGRVVGPPGLSGGPGFGGGIYIERGTVSITDCTLTNHHAFGGEAKDLSNPVNYGGAGFGGAIYNEGGTVSVTNSIVSENSAVGGAAFFGDPGYGGRGEGGAIWSSNGTVNLDRTTIRANQSLGAGSSYGGDALGGGVFAVRGVVNVSSSVFSTNLATGATGSPRFATAGTGKGAGAYLADGSVATMFGTIFDSNVAAGGGTGNNFPNIVVTSGGGIHNNGTLSLFQCELRGNQAIAGVGVGEGGGIVNQHQLVLSGTTLAENLAAGGRTASSLGHLSGGAGSGGGVMNTGTMFCTNTTFEANEARGGYGGFCPGFCSPGPSRGGALCNELGVASMVHVTFSRNRGIGLISDSRIVSVPRGEAIYSAGGTTTLKSTLLAYSTSGGSNCFGVVVDAGNNISSDSSGNFTANGSLNNTDPKLGALGDYGGPTRTVPLLGGSPAFDTADSTACPATDQRGVTRPLGPGCDIGAFEASPLYSIRGRVLGWQPAGVQISAGNLSVVPAPDGSYVLAGLPLGEYSIVPSGADRVFQPKSQHLNLVGDVNGLDFLSLRTNGLTALRTSSQVTRIIFAGSPQENYDLLSNSSLPGSDSVIPFRTDNDGLFEFTVTHTPELGSRMYWVRKP